MLLANDIDMIQRIIPNYPLPLRTYMNSIYDSFISESFAC